jgi:hypothetical protein
VRILDKICEKTKKTNNFAPFVVFLSKIAKDVVPRKKARYNADEIFKERRDFS